MTQFLTLPLGKKGFAVLAIGFFCCGLYSGRHGPQLHELTAK